MDAELLDAAAVNVSRPGEATTVSIRPERVESKSENIPAGVHTLEAEVLAFGHDPAALKMFLKTYRIPKLEDGPLFG